MRYWVYDDYQHKRSLYHGDDCYRAKGRNNPDRAHLWFGPYETVAEAKAVSEALAKNRRGWRDGPCTFCKRRLNW